MHFIVKLHAHEWAAAASIGKKREDLRKARGMSSETPQDKVGGDRQYRNEYAAVTEYALAKHYGKTILQDWCETKSYSHDNHRAIPCDCGANLHVRSSLRSDARLCVHHYDPSPGIFILALVQEALLSILYAGWQTAEYVKRVGRWMPRWRKPCFALDQNLLRPMSTIPPEHIWLPNCSN